MFWYCDECTEWGVADTELDAVVDRHRHKDEHRFGPEPEPEENPVTVWTTKHLAWGISALLGLLSTHYPSLLGVSAVCALLTFVVTGISDD